MAIRGYTLFGEALARHGVDTGFYIMGGPINDAVKAASANGVRMIDVRHEQAAAMMAQAYARVRARPAICMGASGPGTINLTTGLANALIDCAPVVAFGGSSPIDLFERGGFQEIDQLAIMRPVTKWAARVHEARRIPEYVDKALRRAMAGKPGPVYLDLPADVLYGQAEEDEVVWPQLSKTGTRVRACADAISIARVVDILGKAKRPIILYGSGVLWSEASGELAAFVEASGMPFYATPQARGAVPDDHACCYPMARSAAFNEADAVLVVGTRMNYVFSYGRPPRFAKEAKFIRIDSDPNEIAESEFLEVGITGDAGAVLAQLTASLRGAGISTGSYGAWRQHLGSVEAGKADKAEAALASDQTPIHPLRLCKEVRDFIDRDTILVVDGQEILNYGRQSIPSFRPGHRLNSGPFGTMGVGLPFGVGAKAAKPDHKVVVLHGDGSFGLNAMELDTAVRHNLPILVVISLNGGWTADPEKQKPGRNLGYTRFDKMAETLGCHGEYVERPEDIRPALERAGKIVESGKTAVVNVVTDWRARAGGAAFTAYQT
jgi:acetolactate synthase-1/2/3 large subunit